MSVQCSADNLCLYAAKRFKMDTGVCPKAYVCHKCGTIIKCDEGKYLFYDGAFCVDCGRFAYISGEIVSNARG